MRKFDIVEFQVTHRNQIQISAFESAERFKGILAEQPTLSYTYVYARMLVIHILFTHLHSDVTVYGLLH